MDLSKLDLKAYGHFEPQQKAAFTLDTLNLPCSWDFVYQNRRLLLKVDQYGPVYAQVDPPSDIVLFRRDPFQTTSSWLVWLNSPDFAFPITNFFRPNFGPNPSQLPDRPQVTFAPQAATYSFEWHGLRCITELSIAADRPAIFLKLSLTNIGNKPLSLQATPALRPYVNPAGLAPWDKPEWYLQTSFINEPATGFLTRLFNSKSDMTKRRAALFCSDAPGLSGAEVSYERFVGAGNFERPEGVYSGKLTLTPQDAGRWGELTARNSIGANPPVWAMQHQIELQPGQTQEIRQVVSLLPMAADGSHPELSAAREAAGLLLEESRQSSLAATRRQYESLMAARTVDTGDGAFDRYVNEFLPLQLDWVCSLDRGWPSAMRGSRDSANDFTAMVPLDGPWSRHILCELFSCQRSDGWFPRQYSALGRLGAHDLRNAVDAGNWVIEFLHSYLCWTKDTALLDEPLPWLDQDAAQPVLTHALRALEYYLAPGNIGEHGLSKLGEGDWLDSVNRAGIRGRGESVMVTNQTIISLTQMSQLVRHLQATGKAPANAQQLLHEWATRKQQFIQALRKHAFNRLGYFNSNFNDDGKWLFSDRDPDGEMRISTIGNWPSIYSGAAGELTESVLNQLEFLKCDNGYRLYWPPMGKVPIPSVGRSGTGDCLPGRSENGNAYNQGSHGFLGRALAVAGKGDLLFDVIQWMLPYDQSRHPVATTMTPPYAVVNCWNEVPPFKNRGLMTFLTGSIAYALRAVYEWMLGIQPRLSGLAVDPCVPSHLPRLSARFTYMGKAIHLEVLNPGGSQAGAKSMTLNGRPVTTTDCDPYSGRKVFVADDSLLLANNHLVVTM